MEKPADIAMQVLRSFLFDRHQWQMYARIWLAMLLLIVALYAGYQFMPEYYYVPLIPVAFLIIAVVRTRKKKEIHGPSRFRRAGAPLQRKDLQQLRGNTSLKASL